MSSRSIILILVFILSEAVGVALGEWFFHLYLQAVPPMALSSFNAQSSRIAHLFYGAGVGLLLFIWYLLGNVAGRLARPKVQNPAPMAR